MDEETKKTAAANAFRQRLAGLILSGDPDLAERAYREMQYVRALAGSRREGSVRTAGDHAGSEQTVAIAAPRRRPSPGSTTSVFDTSLLGRDVGTRSGWQVDSLGRRLAKRCRPRLLATSTVQAAPA